MFAVGVTPRSVYQIIAYEAVAIGVIGAIIGVTVTFAAAFIFMLAKPQIAVDIPWWGALFVIFISVLCCAVAGMIPAKQAIRVNIINVLREE